MDQPSQDPVIAFLEGALGSPCRRIDTHAASIFLAGDRAWKLKRAVHFPYLDFTTVEARRAALDAELRLNRRTAPDLYLAVHPIVRAGDTYAIGGQGEAIDWLLEMKRFPDEARLDNHAAAHGLDTGLMLRLAERIHAFHADAEPLPAPHASEAVRRLIDGNRESFGPYEAMFGVGRIERLIAAQHALCDRHAALLDLRGRRGKVRHIHGDLHLANIAVIDGEPVPFDCLEFSEALATSDIVYDLAFLLMDLWHRDQRAAANIVFNRYFDLAGEEDAVRLLPLFLSLRATVRAHVLAATATRSARSEDAQEAERFLALAEALIGGGVVAAVAIGGLSGAGKTGVARAIGGDFGAAPGARILRSDVLRKRLAGVPPEQRLPEALYSPLASRTVYELLADCTARHLSFHSFVIVDAVLAQEDERALLARAAAHAHVAFVGIWLEASLEQRLARVGARTGDASDADAAIVRRQSGHATATPAGWCRIVADGRPEGSAAAARAHIASVLARTRA